MPGIILTVARPQRTGGHGEGPARDRSPIDDQLPDAGAHVVETGDPPDRTLTEADKDANLERQVERRMG